MPVAMDSTILIGLVAGALTTGSSIPQAVRIVRTKSAKDVSAAFFVLMSVGVTLWVVYGLVRSDIALVLWNAVSLAFCLSILGLKRVYD
jgi:MtN3 and saliva related transmembrane protein